MNSKLHGYHRVRHSTRKKSSTIQILDCTVPRLRPGQRSSATGHCRAIVSCMNSLAMCGTNSSWECWARLSSSLTASRCCLPYRSTRRAYVCGYEGSSGCFGVMIRVVGIRKCPGRADRFGRALLLQVFRLYSLRARLAERSGGPT